MRILTLLLEFGFQIPLSILALLVILTLAYMAEINYVLLLVQHFLQSRQILLLPLLANLAIGLRILHSGPLQIFHRRLYPNKVCSQDGIHVKLLRVRKIELLD